MSTTTPNLGLTLPTPNVDPGWGNTLNADFTLIDNIFASAGNGTSVGLNVGVGKRLTLGGTMVLGSGDGTSVALPGSVRGPAKTGTNAAGVNLTIDAGNGTGTGGSGSFIVRTAAPGTTGTVANTYRNVLEVNSAGQVLANGFTRVGGYSGSLQGLTIYNNNDSSLSDTTSFIDAFNDLLVSDSAILMRHQTDGGTTMGFSTTPPGARNVNRQVERFRIGPNGELGIGGGSYGTAGQVLQSGGPGAAPTWGSADSMTLLGTITTTSGTSQTLGSLVLTSYKRLVLSWINVSANSSAADFYFNDGTTSYKVAENGSTASDVLNAETVISLDNGVFSSAGYFGSTSTYGSGDATVAAGTYGVKLGYGRTRYSTASTNVIINCGGYTFDGGSVKVYGVR